MKQYKVTILVDEHQLKESYLDQDRSLTEQQLPDDKDLIEQEFNWLTPSGIHLTGDIEEVSNE